MLRSLATLVQHRRWVVLLGALAVTALAAVLGAGVIDRLDPYGAEDPASESALADDRIEQVTEASPQAGIVALVEAEGRIASPRLDRQAREAGVDAKRLERHARELAADARRLQSTAPLSPETLAAAGRAEDAALRAEEAGAEASRALERSRDARSDAARSRVKTVKRSLASSPGVKRVIGYYEAPDRSFLSTDRRAAYLLAYLEPEGDKEEQEAAEQVAERIGDLPGLTLGGAALANQQVNEQVSHDIERAELLALPLIFLLSLVFFRGLVAAALPPLLGGLSIVLTLAGLRIADELGSVSIFAVNLVTALGLGLSIDYSLFVVSRYREELARVGPGVEALRNTLATAGRTVLFSGLTVAAALSSLLVFPQRFLYSMGIGGAMVAVLAVGVALLVLPALLALLGPRINALAPKRLQRAAEADAQPATAGFWYRLSRFVMRRPGRIALFATVALVALGLPFLGIKFVVADAEVLPDDASARQVDAALDERFDSNATEPVRLVLGTDPGAPVDRFVREVERVDGVEGVSPPEREGAETTLVDVTSSHGSLTDPGQEVVRDIRALDAQFDVLVGGRSASFVDLKASLVDHLPLALAIVVGATLVLLFLMTGSVVLPVKALVMNVLTLTATFGILVLVFQDGRLEGLLDYDSQGALEITQPIVLFAVAFGLATDYGVFLLSRIKEARDSGVSDSEAVAVGLERTGRIVTSAALLLTVAVGALVTSDIIFVKQLGFGTALAVLIDATVVRALLVPSLMELLGRRNWWAPGPLRRLHERVGMREAAA